MSNAIKVGETVRVEWTDAAHYRERRGSEKPATFAMRTVGEVVRLDAEAVAVAQSVSYDDEGEALYRDVEVVPRSCVRKMRRLK